VEEYSISVSIIPDEDIETDYLALTGKGNLTIKKGYAWDGPSGLTIDTAQISCAAPWFMMPSIN